jgi:HPt (histidine-containing phosphotransfer) domain-containing protein
MSEEKLYDLIQLNELSGGNDDFVNKMVQMFIDLAPETLDNLNNGLAEGDLDRVGGAAHKIKPSLDMMGIVVLKEKIRTLEANAKNRVNVDQIPALVEDVSSTLKALIAQLRAR